jgi:hypothetical protein
MEQQRQLQPCAVIPRNPISWESGFCITPAAICALHCLSCDCHSREGENPAYNNAGCVSSLRQELRRHVDLRFSKTRLR